MHCPPYSNVLIFFCTAITSIENVGRIFMLSFLEKNYCLSLTHNECLKLFPFLSFSTPIINPVGVNGRSPLPRTHQPEFGVRSSEFGVIILATKSLGFETCQFCQFCINFLMSNSGHHESISSYKQL